MEKIEKNNLDAKTKQFFINLYTAKKIDKINEKVYRNQKDIDNVNKINDFIHQFIDNYHNTYDDKELKEIRKQEINNVSKLKFKEKIYFLASAFTMGAILYIGTGEFDRLNNGLQLAASMIPTIYTLIDFNKNEKLFENQKVLDEFNKGIYDKLKDFNKNELMDLAKKNHYDKNIINNLNKNQKEFLKDKFYYSNNLQIYDKVVITEMISKRLKEIQIQEKYPNLFKFKNSLNNILNTIGRSFKNLFMKEDKNLYIRHNYYNKQLNSSLINNNEFNNIQKNIINNSLKENNKPNFIKNDKNKIPKP